MPTILGTFSLSVPGSQASWTVGPIYRAGQSLRIQAAGAIAWATPGSGSAVVASVPATLTTPGGSAFIGVTFAIPAGIYTGANWEAKGTHTLGIIVQVETGSDVITIGASSGSTPFDLISAASSAQLADINAAAGGSLTVMIQSGGNPANISAFTLSLVGSGMTEYGLPEGGYPPGFPNTHAFSPPDVLQPGSWAGSSTVEPSLIPISLIALLLPDGITPAFASGRYPRQVLQPNEDTTFQASDLFAVGATDPDADYRLWFIFNDGISDFAANTGSFSLTLTLYGIPIMPDPISSLIQPQHGVEGPYGVTVAATRVFNCFENSSFDLDPDQKMESRGLTGLGFETDQDLTTEMSKGSAKGWIDFRDFPYVLQCQYGAMTSSAPAAGVKQWIATDNAYANNVPISYSTETPTAVGERAQGTQGLYFDGIKIDTERDKQFTMSASIYGKILADAITPSTGQNNVQTIAIMGIPTAGTFIVLVEGVPTAAIAEAAIASAVQTALRAIGGNYSAVVVAGSNPTFTVTNPTGLPIPLMVPLYMVGGVNTLTGGTVPTVVISQTTPGGMNKNAGSKVLPGILGVSFAPDLTTLINTPTLITAELTTKIDTSERYNQKWIQNPTQVGHATIFQKAAKDIKDSMSLTMPYNAQVASFIANSRSGTKMYVRFSCVGPAIAATGFFMTIFYDICANVTWEKNSDSQGNLRSVDFKMVVNFDVVSGFRSRWTVINDVASYAS